MLPVRLRLKQIGPYQDETIDFASIPGDVVSIVGENGAGKTMLVDSVFAALFRYFPYRDGFYEYCQGKDARIELEFELNKTNYKSVVNINAVKREMEPWLYINGTAVTDGKNSTFDKTIEKLVGSPKLALVSVYGAQEKKGSFISLPKAERKALFIRLLGLERLQAISDLAASRQSDCSESYKSIQNQIAALDPLLEKVGDIDFLREEHGRAVKELEAQRAKVAEARKITEELRARCSIAIMDGSSMKVAAKLGDASKALGECKRRIADSKAAMADIDSIREQAGQYDRVAAELDSARGHLGQAVEKRTDYQKAQLDYSQEYARIKEDIKSAQTELAMNKRDLERAQADCSIIADVPCEAKDECADCRFLTNAIAARDSLDDLAAKIDNASAKVLHSEQQFKALKEPDRQYGANLEARIKELRNRIDQLEKELVVLDSCRRKLAIADAAGVLLKREEESLPKLQERVQEITSELAQIDELERSVKAAKAALAEAQRKLEMETELEGDLRDNEHKCANDILEAEATERVAMKTQEKIDELNRQLVKVEADRKSYSLLALAFGKTGIQSLEIDAAGPAVSEIANSLLYSCFGPRFSIRFVTQVAKADKSGFRDEFDVFVLDSKHNREGSIDGLSGGEKTIVNEALHLAIALFNRSRASVEWASLWRDEASSAVDDRRAPLYIQMLRKARELGHFQRLFFIAHQSRVTENADAQINVAEGRVTVE